MKEPSLSSNDKHWLAKMPGFDIEEFPFCIVHGSPTFNLVNVKERHSETLVKSREIHYFGQQAADFMLEGDKNYPMCMHFATNVTADNKKFENWHCLRFN